MYKILDLFCGGGGAAMGYWQGLAGDCEITGIDNQPQSKYPFKFIQTDALQYADEHAHEYDFIHASPPCQAYSSMTPDKSKHPDLIPQTRKILMSSMKPYVIENVPGAPLDNPIMLCGTMFGLLVIRHRLFETNPIIWWPPQQCQHLRPVVKHGRMPDTAKHYHGITGHFTDVEFAQTAMCIDWLGQKGLAQAIPPAYTKWLIQQILPIDKMDKDVHNSINRQ